MAARSAARAVLTASGRVRVVDDGDEGLAGVHRLHPAGDDGLGEAGQRGLDRHPDGVEQGDGEHGVGDVEPAGQPQPRRPRAPARAVQREGGAAVGRGGDVGRRPVGAVPSAIDTVTGAGAAGPVGQPAARRVVDVDDLDGGPAVEEQRLGLEVLLEVGVEVEVVAAEVGEARRRRTGRRRPGPARARGWTPP